MQSLEELAEAAEVAPGAARALHDRAGTILRVLGPGDIAVGDAFVVLPSPDGSRDERGPACPRGALGRRRAGGRKLGGPAPVPPPSVV